MAPFKIIARVFSKSSGAFDKKPCTFWQEAGEFLEFATIAFFEKQKGFNENVSAFWERQAVFDEIGDDILKLRISHPGYNMLNNI